MTKYYATQRELNIALLEAIYDGDTVKARLAIESGAEVDVSDAMERTALINAAHGGYKEIVRLLLERNADVNAEDCHKRTALMEAAENGHKEIVQLLLDYDAEVNARDDDGRTALMEAAENGHKEIAQLLLDHGAKVYIKDFWGNSAFNVAQDFNCKDIAKLLEIAEAKQNRLDGFLLSAVKVGHAGGIEKAIERGANPNVEDENGIPILQKVLDLKYDDENRRSVAIKALINAGADVAGKDRQNGRTALMKVAENGQKDVVALLIDLGAKVDAIDDDGETALMKAAENGYKDVVALLEAEEKKRNLIKNKKSSEKSNLPPRDGRE